MALLCDRPSYTMTEEGKSQIETLILDSILDGDAEPEVEMDVDCGTINAVYYKDTNTINACLIWADRDGDEDYYDLEEWELTL